MQRNTLEAGWLLRQIDAAHERASKLPNWLTKSNLNSGNQNDDRRRDTNHQEVESRRLIPKSK
jgi:hypothetical protein